MHLNKEILYATTSSYFQTMQHRDKKKKRKRKNRKNDEVSSDDRREMKFKRTLSVLIAFSWWSKRSFHVLSLLPFYRIEKRDTSAEKRKKRKKEKRREKERNRKGRHVPVNFHLSQPCLVLKSFECTVAIRLRRFPSYFLSSNLVKERRIIHACAYIYIYICQGIFAQEKEHEST